VSNKVEWASEPGYYGGDLTHACSAWTSTSRELTPEKIERIPKLLRMLADNKHYTPFEKSFLHFLVTCDTASHIHLIKHRIGVSINGESARYKELKDDKTYVPDDWPEGLKIRLAEHNKQSLDTYHDTLEILTPTLGRKRAKESARYFLPYSNQVTLDVSFNFKSFMHFQGLRNKFDAQEEIQKIAQEMLELVQGVDTFQHSLRAFGY
jgi:flavin-dependent thymidylate synthase